MMLSLTFGLYVAGPGLPLLLWRSASSMNVTCNDVDARHLLNLMLSWSAAAVICSASCQQTQTPADQEFLLYPPRTHATHQPTHHLTIHTRERESKWHDVVCVCEREGVERGRRERKCLCPKINCQPFGISARTQTEGAEEGGGKRADKESGAQRNENSSKTVYRRWPSRRRARARTRLAMGPTRASGAGASGKDKAQWPTTTETGPCSTRAGVREAEEARGGSSLEAGGCCWRQRSAPWRRVQGQD
jgi:hypothetical protein